MFLAVLNTATIGLNLVLTRDLIKDKLSSKCVRKKNAYWNEFRFTNKDQFYLVSKFKLNLSIFVTQLKTKRK